jgi:adenylate cyclase
MNAPRARFTLSQVFAVGLLGLTLLFVLFFSLILDRSRASILRSSAQLQESAARRAAALLDSHLRRAEAVGQNLSRQLAAGACHFDSPGAAEPCLLAQLLENDELAEVTLTRATKLGETDDGVQLAPTGRWQLAAIREQPGPGSPSCTRLTEQRGKGFSAGTRCNGKPGPLEEVLDPTEHATFTTPAEARFADRTLWSDLSYSGLDAHRPERERRVVVNVLKPLYAPGGAFLGILRVSVLAEALDGELARLQVNEGDPHDPFRVFLTDDTGRLITRLTAADQLFEDNDDLRVRCTSLPPEVAGALALPLLSQLDGDHPFVSSTFDLRGRSFFASFRALDRTQDWRLGIVGPADYYLVELQRARRWLWGASLSLLAVLILLSALGLRAISGGLHRIQAQAAHMRELRFFATPVRTGFRDVERVLDSLERAKTALRALGKYVPVELVRQLYDENREPALGGELRELTLLFTDIQGFTTLSEKMAPARLAQVFGLYIEAMTDGIHEANGTVDKYIGDGVMAMWNAPRELPGHALAACRGALACVERARKLFASEAWRDLPPLVTRFGIHRAEVMVGNFGAPDRFNFTALGDGVNLASRLESLNKLYGTTLLVSESVYAEARGELAFRRLDRVAVKGKQEGVVVYELLGPADLSGPRIDAARRYEQALLAHDAREFARAIAICETNLDDPPSRMLLLRCGGLLDDPPPADWDGIHTATSK